MNIALIILCIMNFFGLIGIAGDESDDGVERAVKVIVLTIYQVLIFWACGWTFT